MSYFLNLIQEKQEKILDALNLRPYSYAKKETLNETINIESGSGKDFEGHFIATENQNTESHE